MSTNKPKAKKKKKKKKLEFHPVTDFCRRHTEEEYQSIKADIERFGQKVKIPLYKGKGIDGRCRARACEELGIDPVTEEVDIQEGELVTYAFSLNEMRRHTTSEQRAALVVKLAPEFQKEALARQQAGKSADGKAGGRGKKKKPPQELGEGKSQVKADKHAGETSAQLAKLVGTNRNFVGRALAVAKKDPTLLEKVIRGELKLAEAKRLTGTPKAPKKPTTRKKVTDEHPNDLPGDLTSAGEILDRACIPFREAGARLSRAQREESQGPFKDIQALVAELRVYVIDDDDEDPNPEPLTEDTAEESLSD